MGLLAVVCVLDGFATYVSLRLAAPLAAYLKETGISIATRATGLLIAAIAVEMIARGSGAMFGLKVL